MSSICLPAGDVFIPVKLEEENLYSGITELLAVIRPTWPAEDIKFKTFTDGITNKLIGCHLQNDTSNEEDIVLVRIYGNKTDLIIDRKAELRNLKCLNAVGLAPKVYGVFENGLVYQYCPGIILTVESVKDSHVYPLVARQMAKMHKVELPSEITRDPMVWDKIEHFLALLPEPFSDKRKHERFVKSLGSMTKLRIEFERIKTLLSKTDSPLVFAHNDLLLGNVIYNANEEKVSFIDYEYAAYNFQAFDIANHFNEFVGLSIEDIDYGKYPNKDFQFAWIEAYLKEYLGVAGSVPAETVEKVYAEVQQMALASHFMWGVWSLVQFVLSDIDFDFMRYAEIRLFRYYETKDDILKRLI